jgi:hypothetical protein
VWGVGCRVWGKKPLSSSHFPLLRIRPKAYSAIQANKNETFALRISPDW